MKSSATRRDVLKLLGGSLAGLFLTPVPWKLLDDTAIWTQTGPWVSKLPRGPESALPGMCTLCPAGCPVTLDCVDGIPFRTRSAEGSGLCAFGFAFHQAPYHPLRLRTPLHIVGTGSERSVKPVESSEIAARVQELMKVPGTRIAVLDQRPGRTASLFYRHLMRAAPGGLYVVPPNDESMMFGGLSCLMEEIDGALGLDVQRTRLVISFGAPLLENQGATGIVGRNLRKAGVTVVQVEAGISRTGILADTCLQVLPGSEAVLAAGLAGIILNEFSGHDLLERYARTMGSKFTASVRRLRPDDVARVTGIPADDIITLARTMIQEGPSAVLSGPSGTRSQDDDIVLGSLNLLLDSTGPRGCLRSGRAVPVPSYYHGRFLAPVTDLRSIPDGSLNILVVEASHAGAIVSGRAIRRTLNPDRSIMLVFSPTLTGVARIGDYVLPTAGPLEVLAESTGFTGVFSPRFGLTRTMIPCPECAVDPVTFLGGMFGSSETSDTLIKARIAAIHASRRGSLVGRDGTEVQVRDLASPDDLQAILLEGGVWQDRTVVGRSVRRFKPVPREITLRSSEPLDGLVLVVVGGIRSFAELPPVMTKLVQESGLWDSDATVRMAPGTASLVGVEDGDRVTLSIGAGEWTARVIRDARLRPGVLQLSASPAPVAMDVDALESGPELSEVFGSDAQSGTIHHPVVVRRI